MISENDISKDLLNQLLEKSDDQALLNELVSISREYFGFYTKHTPRAYEYVWIVRNYDQMLMEKKVLDVGAGLNPVPIYLAKKGGNVTTVDSSAFIRNVGDDKSKWNEWGFFDYNLVHPRIRSFNVDINSLEIEQASFDLIYSVSVIEHIPAEARRQLIAKLALFLKSGGSLLLTVDLYKEQRNLWNYNYGVVVEPIELHGTLDNLIHELEQYFSLIDCEIVSDAPEITHIDIATIKLVRL